MKQLNFNSILSGVVVVISAACFMKLMSIGETLAVATATLQRHETQINELERKIGWSRSVGGANVRQTTP